MFFLKKESLTRILYFLSFLVLCTSHASCQRQLSPQAISAIDLFDKKDYLQAQSKFKVLLEKYPKDPLYQFYTGACLIELGQNIEEAAFYLKSAASKNAHPKALFYLAKAYYLQFNFKEAGDAFKEAQSMGKRQELRGISIAEELKRTSYANEFFSLAANFDFLNKTKINKDSIQKSFSNLLDDPQKWNLPDNAKVFSLKSSKQTHLYFSMPVKNGSQRDIFVANLNAKGEIIDFKNLGNIINTEEDEDFAFFSEKENRLYFASKGHKSVGGYDIFFSQYSKNQWSVPEQLPYPINTPWDDFLIIPLENEQIFISNRKSGNDFYVYHINPYQNSEIITLNSREEILSYLDKKVKNKNGQTDAKNIADPIKEAEPIVLISANERQKLIEQALILQKSSDSLLILARQIKTELHITDDATQRSKLFANLSKFEKKSVQNQDQANSIYRKILNSTTVKDSSNLIAKVAKPKALFTIGKKQIYSKVNPIPFDQELPSGIIFRIQLGAFSKNADIERFGNMAPISAEALQDGKIIKYYVGIFAIYDDAEKALQTIKDSGFKEAFIVSYYDNKKIPVERAKDLEK